PSLWQTQKTGKFIGLDHNVALGKNGLSLNEFYTSYASSEGSNLDGGKTSNGNPVDTSTTATTSKTTTTTTSKTTTTTSSATTSATTSGAPDTKADYGDSNCDGSVNLADAILIMQVKANPAKYSFMEQGEKNADCNNPGDGVTNKDALAIQRYLLGLVASLPEKT
ncbi:MAG: dockerin type I repeat-containing protein, partial [Prevotella sp.]|nr:dockerin type I repeat-containing protein [Prevotella sp.]